MRQQRVAGRQDAFKLQPPPRTGYLLTWHFSDDSGENERLRWNGPDWIDPAAAFAYELLRGDARPLYLGWLARLSAGQLDDDAVEPPTLWGWLNSLRPTQALTRFWSLTQTSWPLPPRPARHWSFPTLITTAVKKISSY